MSEEKRIVSLECAMAPTAAMAARESLTRGRLEIRIAPGIVGVELVWEWGVVAEDVDMATHRILFRKLHANGHERSYEDAAKAALLGLSGAKLIRTRAEREAEAEERAAKIARDS